MDALSAVGNFGVWGGVTTSAAGSSADLAVDSVTQAALNTFLEELGDSVAQLGGQAWQMPTLLQPRESVAEKLFAALVAAASDGKNDASQQASLGFDIDGNVVVMREPKTKRPEMLAIVGFIDGDKSPTVTSTVTTPREKMVQAFGLREGEKHLEGTHLGPYLLDLVLSLRGEGPHAGILESATKVAADKSLVLAERVMALRLMEEELFQQDYTFEEYLNAAELLIDILEDERNDPRLKEIALSVIQNEFEGGFLFTSAVELFDKKIPPLPGFKIGPNDSQLFSYADLKKFEARIRDVTAVLPDLASEELPDPSHFSPNAEGNVESAWLHILGEYLGLQAEAGAAARFDRALQIAANTDLPVYKRGLALIYALDILKENVVSENLEMLQQAGRENEELLHDATLILEKQRLSTKKQEERQANVYQLPPVTVEELQKSWNAHLNWIQRWVFRKEFKMISQSGNPNALRMLLEVLNWLDHWTSLEEWHLSVVARGVKAIAAALRVEPQLPFEGMVVDDRTLWDHPFKRGRFTEWQGPPGLLRGIVFKIPR